MAGKGIGTNYFTKFSSTVDCALTDESGNCRLIKCTVANLPTGAGFAIGCIAMTEAGALYSNTGTASAATFTVLSTVTAGSINTTSLADAGVTLAKLAAGITPSHVVKYAGKITWSGSGASLGTSVPGVVSTDIVVATIQTAPTQAAYLKTAAPTTDTVTLVLSAANTSNDAVIAYQVLRAAS